MDRKPELYHHGVKGQKWGVRRYQNKDGTLTPAGEKRYAKLAQKTTRKYERVGKLKGMADFYKSKGDEASKGYDEKASMLDKQAKTWEKKGNHIASYAAKKASQMYKNKSVEARKEYDETADYYLKRSEILEKKVSNFATKNRIDLGKTKVNQIIKESRNKKYETEKEWDRREQEWEKEQRDFYKFDKFRRKEDY